MTKNTHQGLIYAKVYPRSAGLPGLHGPASRRPYPSPFSIACFIDTEPASYVENYLKQFEFHNYYSPTQIGHIKSIFTKWLNKTQELRHPSQPVFLSPFFISEGNVDNTSYTNRINFSDAQHEGYPHEWNAFAILYGGLSIAFSAMTKSILMPTVFTTLPLQDLIPVNSPAFACEMKNKFNALQIYINKKREEEVETICEDLQNLKQIPKNIFRNTLPELISTMRQQHAERRELLERMIFSSIVEDYEDTKAYHKQLYRRRG